MRREYLGDSYDAVKRMWQELLAPWAPLHAAPRFIPDELRDDYTSLTRIPMLPDEVPATCSILNDPDTGIRLPGARNQGEGQTHVTIETIGKQLAGGAKCVITFDQSNYRNSGMKLREQREEKLRQLTVDGFQAFYYVSHAPFLFATRSADALDRVCTILRKGGILASRLEKLEDH